MKIKGLKPFRGAVRFRKFIGGPVTWDNMTQNWNTITVNWENLG